MRFREAPEVRFLSTPVGMVTAIGLSVAAVAGAIAYVRRDRARQAKRPAAAAPEPCEMPKEPMLPFSSV